MPPRTTRWPIEPHTQAKHLILERYLKAWLPIMASFNGRIVYIDAFAGPGRYSKGEEGSPIIALKTLLGNPLFQSPKRRCDVGFFFIEEDQERAAALTEELNQLEAQFPIPKWVSYEVINGEFASEMTKLLDAIERRGKLLAPTFAFIDPFGYSGVPLDVIARMARNPSCECLITFVYESIVRHGGKPEDWIQAHIDKLFDTNEWKSLLAGPDPKERMVKMIELYRKQLTDKAKFRFVRTFSMFDRSNQAEYVLFFGTNNRKGLSVMKQAMWKADPLSGQIFSDKTDAGQMVLLQSGEDLGLRYQLQEKFRGQGFVAIGEIERFVLEETAYSEAMHLKQKTLAPMERESIPLIKVQRPLGKQNRKGTYPEGTTVMFL
ncbi:MAG: three-Cys-motif partner protein TcmP [Nitrospirae bacterium]|nr:MAG: three-Cys-motif partner protein TcmP [Nitrospirota bacterium]